MTPDEARQLFSAEFEGDISPAQHAELETVLAANPALAAEYRDFTRTLSLVHAIPQCESRLDTWPELAVHVNEYRRLNRLPLWARLRMLWQNAAAQFGSGMILYTQAVAMLTLRRFEKYIVPRGQETQRIDP